MKVIVPNALTLLESSLAETDAADGALWSNTAAYAKDALIRHEHVRYKSLVADNKGNDPAETHSGLDAKWQKLGATAPYLMLDAFVETQTVGGQGEILNFTVPFNRATAFALLNVEGLTASVTVTDTEEGKFFAHEYGLTRDISGFSLYEYNYSPIDSKINVAATDIPMPILGTLRVAIDPGQGSQAKLGMLVAGMEQALGVTKYDAELGVTDYSKKETDDFGVATLVRRGFASSVSLQLYLRPNRMDYVARVLQGLRATPAVWIGDNRDDGAQSLTVYGWLEDWRMVCAGPDEIQLSLEIQGLI